MIDSQTFQDVVRNFSRRLKGLETRETPPIPSSTVVGLPASNASTTGRLRYVTNGLKVGETTGAGTGVLAYNNGTNWRRTADDAIVSA